MFLILVWYINLCGCFWGFVVSQNEIWIPNKDFIWAGSAQVYEFYYSHWGTKWMVSFYIGYYLFAIGEVCPRNSIELITAIFLMIINAIINGIVIGNMSIYLAEIYEKKVKFQEKMDTVNMAMK